MMHASWSRRLALVGATGAGALTGCCIAQPLTVAFKNTAALPSGTVDQYGMSFTVTGLSGLSYRGVDSYGNHIFLAVMDNSNRLVIVSVTLATSGSITAATLTGFTIAEARDFEDVVALPLAQNTVLLCEEDTPAVREYSLASGALVRSYPTPPVFSGRRGNFGFEGLTRSRDGLELWTANEEALTPDGALSTPTTGSTVRLLKYSVDHGVGTPDAQYAYVTAPIHGSVIMGSRSGVSAVVVLPSGRLLTLERSLAGPFPSFQSRIYDVSVAGATDVSAMPALAGQTYTPAIKTKLYEGNHTNMEGLALGPRLASGDWSLIGIVDDGDHLLSTNRLVAFTISGPVGDAPCPADYDGNSFVNGDDFDAFAFSFYFGDPSADFDLNTFVNGDDVDAFAIHFDLGC